MLYISPRDKMRILAQKPSMFTQKRLRWLTILSSLPLFGMVTAFGISPQSTSFQTLPPERKIIQTLSLPEVTISADSNSTYWHQENIRRGDTIAAILTRLEINQQDKADFIHAAKDSKAMRQLKPGEVIHAETTGDGELLTLRYFYGNGEQFLMEKIDDAFEISEQSAEAASRIRVGSGVIESSLFAATDAAGLSNNIAIQIANIFASDIDFYRDLHKGDRFTVVYETFHDDERNTHRSRVLAVEFINKGKSYRAVYFQAPGEEGDYYTPTGESLRKPFLRAPLEFSRISSGFSNARFHPILKQWRAHRGIDYAAPKGTPVMATADGVVEYSGWQNGYGNLVILKHHGEYSTAYGHLSGFKKGLRKAGRVKQGDVIGYVGATGMATGPHLHYELRINGVQRDPSKIIMPAAAPISKKNRTAFHRETKELVARLDLMRNTNFASAQ
ncbi:MAG TPA: peptidase M23 [Nitrosomonas nitrosa]|uniref:Murein DD-endopeptidase MepM and murein hydrolase activator NlpD, contain LysM domain n=2 Tax=Nitrosomonas nitrosa TaxID=52442 RepID=A0A8H8Z0U1_9PROT|nr:Murein DD-endopeptidase MepM and murein hydrolase activator NlpD, contain LysM domain [Nitrosomonas nitrosa]HBZ29451.1 peptidase M23 [Nitrosomonas nitrosa]